MKELEEESLWGNNIFADRVRKRKKELAHHQISGQDKKIPINYQKIWWFHAQIATISCMLSVKNAQKNWILLAMIVQEYKFMKALVQQEKSKFFNHL